MHFQFVDLSVATLLENQIVDILSTDNVQWVLSMSGNEQSDTSQSALPATDLRQVVQETVANIVAQLSNSLASSIDQRLKELKCSFVPAQSEACASKKLKLEAQTIKKLGNAHQYGHEVKVLEKFEEAIDELDRNKIEKDRYALQEGKSIVLHR